VALLAEKNPQSLEQALKLIQGTVFSFSMKVCGQREDAEDTMQEVLVKSLPQLPKFESPRALLVWLYKVAKNRCLMSRRRSRFAPEPDLSLDGLMPDRYQPNQIAKEVPLNPESLAIRSQEARRLREAIQELPPQYRIVLVLRDMEGLTDEEVGEVTGVRPGTVRVRLHRARLFVRKALTDHGKRARTSKASIISPAVANAAPDERPVSCKALFAQLSDYLDEQLDDSLCDELGRHLDGCEPCKAFLASLERSIQQCRMAPNESPDPRVAAKLRRDLVSEYQSLMARINAPHSIDPKQS
jgi:RNA polymerase sigma-70 factor, ECF subfamily